MWDMPRFVSELETIVNMDSFSADREDVGRVGHALSNLLRADGFFVTAYDGGTRVQATTHETGDLPAEDESAGPSPNPTFDVLLIGHMDTVFPAGTVRQRPFRLEGDTAYGPGVSDMKSGLILAIHLARQLKKERPDLRLCLAFNGDEEVGSIASKGWLRTLARRARFVFVFEPGRKDNGFVRRRKGCADMTFRFHGIASHAGSAPAKGANAIVEMARWITTLAALQDLPAGLSVSPDIVQGGTASNVIAENASFKADIRFTDEKSLARVQRTVTRLQNTIQVPGVTVEVIPSPVTMPMNPSPATEDLMRTMERAALDLGQPLRWVDTGGVSDANHVADLGVPTLCGCGPCGGGAHTEAEYLDLGTVPPRLDLLHRVLSGL